MPEHLIVIGAGAIGLELGSVWRRLGARVTVLELAPSILPGYDADVVREMEKVFRQQGLDFRTGVRVTGGARQSARACASSRKRTAAPTERVEGDYVLVVDRAATEPRWYRRRCARARSSAPRGEILVDDQMRTNLPHVYAIGDAVGGKLLAHKAEEEGVVAVEVIAGQPSRMHYHSIPSIVYTWPEIAVVGLAEHEVKASGRPYKIGRFPYWPTGGRARWAT